MKHKICIDVDAGFGLKMKDEIPVLAEIGFDGCFTTWQVGSENRSGLMVKTNYEATAVGEVSYDNYVLFSTSLNEVVFLVDITVSDGEITKTFPEERITMRKEKGIWLLDTTTYASVK